MSSLGKSQFDADIGIVGAGVAGLTAARQLRTQGRTCVLLEASHRIGGRAYTEWLQPGVPFDLGAHWIHSDELNPFTQIAAELDASVERDEEEYTAAEYFEDGEWLPKSAAQELADFADRQFAAVIEAANQGGSQSVFDVIDNDNRWAPYFCLFFGQDLSCDVDQVCVQDLAAYVEAGTDLAVGSGLGNLIQDYGADVPVSLNSTVLEIDSTGPGVRIVTAKGELRVAQAIVTVSTGVLATQQIKFNPRLPESKIAALNGLPMGSHTRVGLTFEGNFLHDLPDDFTIRSGDDEPLHFRNRPCGFDFVEVVAGGRLGSWMEKSGEHATLDLVEVYMKKLLGNDFAEKPSRHIISAWDDDAWTKGAYSYALPGAAQQRRQLAEPIDQKIFFAGEATSTEFFSTIHGAYFSALHAVSIL
ncbi:MAG: flavin monoamine oxidase family protein [Woeseiaceae bacterium]